MYPSTKPWQQSHNKHVNQSAVFLYSLQCLLLFWCSVCFLWQQFRVHNTFSLPQYGQKYTKTSAEFEINGFQVNGKQIPNRLIRNAQHTAGPNCMNSHLMILRLNQFLMSTLLFKRLRGLLLNSKAVCGCIKINLFSVIYYKTILPAILTKY